MRVMRLVLVLLGVALALAPARHAASAGEADDGALRRRLTEALGVAPGRIEPAPLPGWLVVTFGGHVVLVSEDGVLGAAHRLAEELACASVIHEGALTPEPEAKLLCDHFGLDPMHVPSEGNVLVVVRNEMADTFVQTMQAMKIPAAIIGELRVGGNHLLDKEAYSINLPAANRKPLLKLLQ